MDRQTRTEIEASAFRELVLHLQTRSDVQNIDLMNLAGFCRNCLSKWLMSVAVQQNTKLEKDEALKQIYGMAYEEWKEQFQAKATSEQLAGFEQTKPLHAKILIES